MITVILGNEDTNPDQSDEESCSFSCVPSTAGILYTIKGLSYRTESKEKVLSSVSTEEILRTVLRNTDRKVVEL